MVTLRHGERDAVVTPLDGRWRVECVGRVVESVYLEYAIAEALEIGGKDAVPVAAQLLDEYLDGQTPSPDDQNADGDDPSGSEAGGSPGSSSNKQIR